VENLWKTNIHTAKPNLSDCILYYFSHIRSTAAFNPCGNRKSKNPKMLKLWGTSGALAVVIYSFYAQVKPEHFGASR
jgi:hypothetical protein